MNKETIKSVILIALVCSSLFLTLALWTYQPEYEELDQTTYLEETELDGEQRNFGHVVHPKQIVFNDSRQYSKLPTKELEMDLFAEITEWDFSNIDERPSSGSWGVWSPNMELVFQEEIPMVLIDQIFQIDEFNYEWNPNRTFNRVFFQLTQGSEERIQVSFTSDGEEEVLNGVIESVSAYEYIEEFFNRADVITLDRVDLETNEDQSYIYLTNEQVEVPEQTVFTEDLNEQPLINVLFSNPALVRQQNAESQHEEYYTDGTRLLTLVDVFNSNQFLTYNKPSTLEPLEPTSRRELMLRSLEYTNDHHGWTDDYRLDTLDRDNSTINYRIHYKGIPVFDSDDFMTMVQVWGQQELQSLSRPLFKITDPLPEGERVELQSGVSVYNYLVNSSDELSMSLIEDIKIGYEVVEDQGVSNTVTFLEPTWFVKYVGTWRPLSYFEDRVAFKEDG
ncbi:YycH family regulatory protein [Alkalibacillus silvisoli]|uniref:Two-component system activity regulator YycH n=1 Tax=Alkalibacillus silvisoli TaxID=392823 RepID=A0ABP3K1M9_9BACI